MVQYLKKHCNIAYYSQLCFFKDESFLLVLFSKSLVQYIEIHDIVLNFCDLTSNNQNSRMIYIIEIQNNGKKSNLMPD